jgi:hypothetical protein
MLSLWPCKQRFNALKNASPPRILRVPAVLVCLAAIARSALAGPVESPPIQGQPPGYAGAIGRFQLRADAQPTELEAEEPLEFVLRVRGSGSIVAAPTRPNLRALPQFTRLFLIEDLRADSVSGGNTWTFKYRLRPLSAAVTEIPSVRLDYYTPGAVPREKGYRSTYSDRIPLTVRPRAPLEGQEIGPPVAIQLPDRIRQINTDPQILEERPAGLPILAPILALFGPPVLFVGVMMLIREPRDSRRRARAALHALRSLEHADPDEQIAGAGATVRGFLGERLQPPGESGPDDVQHLTGSTLSPRIAQAIDEFFARHDAGRFGPVLMRDSSAVVEAAERLILLVESEG